MSKRDISPLLQAVRNFLLGRKHTTALRYQADLVTRSPPPPNLPAGPHSILSANYYYARDGRREVEPPLVAAGSGAVAAIAAPAEVAPKKVADRTPGKSYAWD